MTPEIRRADVPQLLHEATFPLRAYPVETIVAEKLATMMALGDLMIPTGRKQLILV